LNHQYGAAQSDRKINPDVMPVAERKEIRHEDKIPSRFFGA
jgi:hypothetical protein